MILQGNTCLSGTPAQRRAREQFVDWVRVYEPALYHAAVNDSGNQLHGELTDTINRTFSRIKTFLRRGTSGLLSDAAKRVVSPGEGAPASKADAKRRLALAKEQARRADAGLPPLTPQEIATTPAAQPSALRTYAVPITLTALGIGMLLFWPRR